MFKFNEIYQLRTVEESVLYFGNVPTTFQFIETIWYKLLQREWKHDGIFRKEGFRSKVLPFSWQYDYMYCDSTWNLLHEWRTGMSQIPECKDCVRVLYRTGNGQWLPRDREMSKSKFRSSGLERAYAPEERSSRLSTSGFKVIISVLKKNRDNHLDRKFPNHHAGQ